MSYTTLNQIDNWVLHKLGRRMEVHLLDIIQDYAKQEKEFNIHKYLVETETADRFDMAISSCNNCPKFYLYSGASYAYGEDGNKPDGWVECNDGDCFKEYCDQCIKKILKSKKNSCGNKHFYCNEHKSNIDYCTVCNFPITCNDCYDRECFGNTCNGCNNKFCNDFHQSETGFPTHRKDGSKLSWTKEKWDKFKKEVLPPPESHSWKDGNWPKWYGAFKGTNLEACEYWCTICDRNGKTTIYGKCCKDKFLDKCEFCEEEYYCKDCLIRRENGKLYCKDCDRENPPCQKCNEPSILSGWGHECGGKCKECDKYFCHDHITLDDDDQDYCLDCYQELKQ